MSAQKTLLWLAVAGILVGVVSGCGGSKVTKSNFDKVQTGMTRAEVEKVLGKGTEAAAAGGALGNLALSGTVVTWTEGDKSITVTFVNDKVVAKVPKGL